ncbi:hypothetical protein C1645_838036, partial [Glomus cerebriforme]
YVDEFSFNPDRISFTCFSGAIDCLTYLSELHCSLDIPSEFFYKLSKTSHNLHSLNISKYKDSKISNELKELISLQDNLKNLRLSAINSDWTDIIPSLTKHSNTLTKLHLDSKSNHDLLVSWISLFSNLQEIKFTYIKQIASEVQLKDFEKFQYAIFHKLQYLRIPMYCIKLEHVKKFLENNGKNLREFYIKKGDFALNLSIAKFCPNLKKLSIIYIRNYSELNTLITIFNSCQHLESIRIWCEVKDVLETVTKHSPKNLCKLKICNSSYLPENLESFFISWKSQISRTLIIKKYECFCTTRDNIEEQKMIKKYKNLGIIKKFEFKYPGDRGEILELIFEI